MENNAGSGFVKLVKVMAVVTAVSSLTVAVGRFMSRKSRELEKANVGQKVKKYLAFMNGKFIKISEEVKEISIKTYAGGVTLDLTRAEISKDMDVKVRSLMSGVIIKVPPMVRVVLDGTSVMSGFANLVPNYEREDIPTVFVYAESVMGGIAVQMVPDVE